MTSNTTRQGHESRKVARVQAATALIEAELAKDKRDWIKVVATGIREISGLSAETWSQGELVAKVNAMPVGAVAALDEGKAPAYGDEAVDEMPHLYDLHQMLTGTGAHGSPDYSAFTVSELKQFVKAREVDTQAKSKEGLIKALS